MWNRAIVIQFLDGVQEWIADCMKQSYNSMRGVIVPHVYVGKLDCHNFATMHSCTPSNNYMGISQFYLLLIDYGRQVYYWKITENIRLCRFSFAHDSSLSRTLWESGVMSTKWLDMTCLIGLTFICFQCNLQKFHLFIYLGGGYFGPGKPWFPRLKIIWMVTKHCFINVFTMICFPSKMQQGSVMELGVICPCSNIAPRHQRVNIEKYWIKA